MKKCCPGDYPYVQVTFVIDIQTFMVISDLASGPVHQCAYVCRQPKFQLKSENDGQLPSWRCDAVHILFLVNLCPWPRPMKPPWCMCIHFFSTHIDNCSLTSPSSAPHNKPPFIHVQHKMHISDSTSAWCVRALKYNKDWRLDSSGNWRRNGDRLFCWPSTILKERERWYSYYQLPRIPNSSCYSSCSSSQKTWLAIS